MKKNFLRVLIVIVIIFASVEIVYAYSSSRKFSGGMISEEPSKEITQKKNTCESGATCHGTCSNTWKETTNLTCKKGTFTLNVYSPKSASTDYCIPSSAKGNGTISSGKLIIDAYTQPVQTQVGTCTCVSGEYCEETTTETVSVNLAQITLFQTNKK